MDFPSDEKVKELQALAEKKRQDKLLAAEERERQKLEEERKKNAPPEPPPPPKPLEKEDLPEDVEELKELLLKFSRELEAMKDKYLDNEDDDAMMTKIVKADGVYGASDEIPQWVDQHCESLDGVALDDSFVGGEFRTLERFKGKVRMTITEMRSLGMRPFTIMPLSAHYHI